MDKINYEIVSLLEIVNKVDTIVFLDTETCGLYGKIRLLQAYHPDWPHPLLTEWPNPLMLAAWLSSGKFTHVWHIAHYDFSTIQRQDLPDFRPVNYEDTFLLSRLHFPRNDRFSLDACYEEVLGYDPYYETGIDKKAMQKMNWNIPVIPQAALAYAALDVLHMPTLYSEVKEQRESFSYKLDMITLGYCMDFQTNGIPTDQEYIANKLLSNTTLIRKLGLPINANSWKQVRKYLHSRESDKKALAIMGTQGGPYANKALDVISARKLLKQNSFLNKWKTPRIFGLFKPSARSGRLTSNDQSLQQLPRELKNAFRPREGHVFIRADYSQLEIYVTCAMSKDPEMIRVLRAGGDIHNHTAEVMFGEKFTKEERRIAKTMNFALLYYGSAHVLGSILLIEAGIFIHHNRLVLLRRKWMTLYKGVARWQQQGIYDWRKKKLWRTPLGREYLGNRVTDQLNIQSQGGGAEVAKLGLHYMYDSIVEQGGILVDFVHDEYIIECKDDPEVYKPICETVADAMIESWIEGSKSFNVKDLPMPVEVDVGKSLGDLGAGKGVIYSIKRTIK